MSREVSNSDDVIDSRDVIARIEELVAMLDPESGDELDNDDYQAAQYELGTLTALAEQGEDLADWAYGETLIRDSYFEDYARELADDIGAVNSHADWPNSYIDWARAADALKMDYTEIDFDGVAYWGRS